LLSTQVAAIQALVARKICGNDAGLLASFTEMSSSSLSGLSSTDGAIS
jgi:hypothetical protein